jgi:hypothetical protein
MKMYDRVFGLTIALTIFGVILLIAASLFDMLAGKPAELSARVSALAFAPGQTGVSTGYSQVNGKPGTVTQTSVTYDEYRILMTGANGEVLEFSSDAGTYLSLKNGDCVTAHVKIGPLSGYPYVQGIRYGGECQD